MWCGLCKPRINRFPCFFHPVSDSAALGERPSRLVRELIGGDERFFPPQEERSCDPASPAGDHNYNQNQTLIDAIQAGHRGAYWDILRRVQRPSTL